MIELVERERCIGCGICVRVCPTRVFDADADGVPTIERAESCQTCFQCEAYCPTDALFVAPVVAQVARDSTFRDAEALNTSGLLGGYRRELGWGNGRPLGARTAIGPEYFD